ncbi:helix-turn-helix domain-containing protein [Caldicoprobacter faecalis]|uniref:Putative transcriptional regulator n=1 Tax=Caldicoprobacter faecalis TaxID=937334 RepID=A0A1I5WV01_9FIRM|nr:helix-turn-helix transcriptional regulator [Caldicoprobacter faecalis]SFQ23529.1 putative transcriptional regulator [Caldicoprobacter faecalis]
MIKIKVSDMLGKYKMTQKELAQKTGIRPATISALYHETIKRIEIAHIDALCKAFNCKVEDIFEYIPDDK